MTGLAVRTERKRRSLGVGLPSRRTRISPIRLSRTRIRRSAGFTLLELMATLVLLAGMVQAGWAIVAVQRRLAESVRLASESLQAERAVRSIVVAETDAGLASQDWIVQADGILDLRAFRGWARVCEVAADGSLLVLVRGIRSPDPTKDSVLVLASGGGWIATDLVSRSTSGSGCGGGVSAELWRTDPSVPDAVVGRFYERGSYHLTDGSLRYRRGAGGRQPLTPSALDPSETTLWSRPGGDAVLSVLPGRGSDVPWTRVLRGNREGGG